MILKSNWDTQVALAPVSYDWLLFKTNVTTPWQKERVWLVLQAHTDIEAWTVDLEDMDHVLRIEPTNRFQEDQVMTLMRRHGFEIEPLLD